MTVRGRYTLAQFAWGALTIGGAMAVVSGRTEPFLSVSQLPAGDFGTALAGFGAAIAGWVAIGQFRRREWRDAGRQVGLSPESGGLDGLTSYADMSGTIRGRSVRVRTVSEGSRNRNVLRTLIEAQLGDLPETGIVVGRTGSGTPEKSAPNFGDFSAETHTVAGEFWAVGDEVLARDVLTREVRDALRAAGEVDGVYAGDVTGILEEAAPDVGGAIGDKLMSVTTGSLTPGDGTTVRWKRKGAIIEPETIEESVDAVVAVADAFETATTAGNERSTGPRSSAGQSEK